MEILPADPILARLFTVNAPIDIISNTRASMFPCHLQGEHAGRSDPDRDQLHSCKLM